MQFDWFKTFNSGSTSADIARRNINNKHGRTWSATTSQAQSLH